MKLFYKKTKKESSGFTIIESVIYMTILAVLLVTIINLMAVLSSSYRSVKAMRSVETGAIAAMDRIIRETRSATSIDTSQSNFGVNLAQNISTAFTLNGLNASSSAVSIQFYVSNGRLMLKENNITLGPVTPSSVSVSSLVFRSYSATTSSAVKVEMTLTTATSSGVISSDNFYGTVVLRGSY